MGPEPTTPRPDGRPGQRRITDVVLPATTAAGVLVLGAARAGDQSLWMDEGASRYAATLPFVDLLRRMWRDEAGMGPYYLALWVWRHAFDSDAGLRWFSVLGGAATAALIVWVAARWFGRSVAITTAVLVITNPFFLRHLTELRAYSWTMAVSIAFTVAFVAALERPTWWRVVVAGVLAGGGVALHTVFVLWIVAAFLMALAAGAVSLRHLARLTALAAVAGIVVAPFVPVMFRRSGQIDWIEATTVRKVVSVTELSLGGTVAGIVLAVGIVAFAVDALRSRPIALRPAMVLAAAPIGGVLLVLASLLKPLLIPRYLAPGFPFACLAGAAGWHSLADRLGARSSLPRARLLLVAVPIVVALSVFVARGPLSDEARPEDPRAAVALVADRFEDGDLVIVDRIGPLVVIDYLDRAGLEWVLGWHLADVDPVVSDTATVFVIGWREGDRPGPALQDETEQLFSGRAVERTDFGLAVVLTATPDVGG